MINNKRTKEEKMENRKIKGQNFTPIFGFYKRMLDRKRFFGLTFIVLSLMAFTSPVTLQDTVTQTPVVQTCSIENTAFKDGEEIVYKLYYNWGFVWVSAGEATFRVKEVGGQFHFVAIGETYPSYDWAFKVRDKFESYVDKKNLLPNKSIRHIQEGGYKLYENVTFDQANHSAKYVRGKTKDKTWSENHTISDCIHDVLSIVYYARNIDYNKLKANQDVPIKVFLDRKEYPLTVRYKGKEANKEIKNMGHYKTHKFTPQLVAGEVFSEGDEMNVWISDDKNRIPLLIESPIAVGSVKAILKSYKGLKYNLTSKVD